MTARIAPALARAVLSRPARLVFGFAVFAFCAAPVPGDAGGCNQEPEALDAGVFFAAKQSIDCSRCNDCALVSASCDAACAAANPTQSFPAGCVPLIHDGEVCLHALSIASCDDYESYVRDDAPATPTECEFCPRRSE